MDNLKLFEFSLQNPEPALDEAYFKGGNLIIGKDLNEPTHVMELNRELIEALSAYSFAQKNNDIKSQDVALEKILKLVAQKSINFSEFVSFWPVLDISHSLFHKMKPATQKTTLKKIIEEYLEIRHGLYLLYGYTPTTLQVGKDAKAHKESGSLGTIKVSKILDSFHFKNANHETVEEFMSDGKKYLTADKKGKPLFKALLRHYNIKFGWSSKKEGKLPDILFKSGEDLFIVEHKHMKEGGGGQDKQMNEVISFIGFNESEKNIHYVSFLDGSYFNLFTRKPLRGKLLAQVKNIKRNLNRVDWNYFVNTAGFIELLKFSVPS